MFVRLIGLVCVLSLLGCGTDSGESSAPHSSSEADNRPALQQVTVALNWFPEAEHGGFYAAAVHGYYEEAGLDVTILPGGPNAPVMQRVASRQVTFGVDNADRILLARAQEADVVALLAPLQTSPRCIMVHQKSGIRDFSDLKDLTLAMSSGAPFASFLLKRLRLENVQIVPYPGNVSQFLLNDDYAQQGYVFSEPFVAEQEGGDPHALMVSDLGFNPYTSILLTDGQTVRDSPEMVQKMVSATLRGWQTYLENPEETNHKIHELNPEMGLEILAYGVETMRPLCVNEDDPGRFGGMSLERWQTLADQLVEVEAMAAGAVDPAEAFTVEFIDRAHSESSSPSDAGHSSDTRE